MALDDRQDEAAHSDQAPTEEDSLRLGVGNAGVPSGVEDPLLDDETVGARTGVPVVDALLDEVDGLEGRDLSDHVEVFERAHATLRGALDGDPGEPV